MKKSTMIEIKNLLTNTEATMTIEEVLAEIDAELNKRATSNDARKQANLEKNNELAAKLRPIVAGIVGEEPMTLKAIYEASTEWGDVSQGKLQSAITRGLFEDIVEIIHNGSKPNTYKAR